MFEKSKWITHSSNDDISILLRKEFTAKEQISSATLSICMLGVGICTINGKNVTEDVLTTPVTKYDSRVYYNTYDVTALVNAGENAIGMHVGNGLYVDNQATWSMHFASWNGISKACAELKIVYENGAEELVVTDSSWKGFPGGCTYNHIRQGEIFDFNIAQKGFDTVGFDDSEWENAGVTTEPGGLIVENFMESERVIRTLSPVKKTGDIYDFGENISGWVKITATGEKGRKITIRYDECLDENGNPKGLINIYGKEENLPMNHENIVILSGGKKEVYRPHFGYFGFRYVEVQNAPEDFDIIAEVVHTDLAKTAEFSSSDEMLNKIHKASVNSTLTNYHSLPVDCPHREQNAWTGDAQLSCNQALINFNMKNAYTKWMYDFKDCQRISGQLPQIVPTSNWGWSITPPWDAALFIIPWQMYQHYGDKSLLNLMYENMERYLNFLTRFSETYILNLGFRDWCPPENQVCACPQSVTSTAYFYMDAVLMGKIATVLGKISAHWEELAKNIKNAWRKEFLFKEELYKSQTFLSCSIYSGLLDNGEEKDIAEKLAKLVAENDFHTDCGILGQKFIFDALSKHGYFDIAYKMVVNPTMPSYAYWINNGATTLCENWNMTNSNNHHMYSEVDHWFYKYLGGLNFDKGEITVDPIYTDLVSDVEVSYKNLTVKRRGKTVTVTAKESVYVMVENNRVKLENDSLTYTLCKR